MSPATIKQALELNAGPVYWFALGFSAIAQAVAGPPTMADEQSISLWCLCLFTSHPLTAKVSAQPDWFSASGELLPEVRRRGSGSDLPARFPGPDIAARSTTWSRGAPVWGGCCRNSGWTGTGPNTIKRFYHHSECVSILMHHLRSLTYMTHIICRWNYLLPFYILSLVGGMHLEMCSI